MVNLPPDRHRTAFLRRDVDAVVTGEPVRTQIVDLGGTELFSSASLPFELVGVVIISGAVSRAARGARARRCAPRGGEPRKTCGHPPTAREWVADQDEGHAGRAGAAC